METCWDAKVSHEKDMESVAIVITFHVLDVVQISLLSSGLRVQEMEDVSTSIKSLCYPNPISIMKWPAVRLVV